MNKNFVWILLISFISLTVLYFIYPQGVISGAPRLSTGGTLSSPPECSSFGNYSCLDNVTVVGCSLYGKNVSISCGVGMYCSLGSCIPIPVSPVENVVVPPVVPPVVQPVESPIVVPTVVSGDVVNNVVPSNDFMSSINFWIKNNGLFLGIVFIVVAIIIYFYMPKVRRR